MPLSMTLKDLFSLSLSPIWFMYKDIPPTLYPTKIITGIKLVTMVTVLSKGTQVSEQRGPPLLGALPFLPMARQPLPESLFSFGSVLTHVSLTPLRFLFWTPASSACPVFFCSGLHLPFLDPSFAYIFSRLFSQLLLLIASILQFLFSCPFKTSSLFFAFFPPFCPFFSVLHHQPLDLAWDLNTGQRRRVALWWTSIILIQRLKSCRSLYVLTHLIKITLVLSKEMHTSLV